MLMQSCLNGCSVLAYTNAGNFLIRSGSQERLKSGWLNVIATAYGQRVEVLNIELQARAQCPKTNKWRRDDAVEQRHAPCSILGDVLLGPGTKF
jgi:hypothetical protein